MAKTITVPKGKRKGDQFVVGGRRYVVVSFKHPISGKQVRYARELAPMKASLAKARKAAKTSAKAGAKKKIIRKTTAKTPNKAQASKMSIPKGARVGSVISKKQGAVKRYFKVSRVPNAPGGTKFLREIKAPTAKKRNPCSTTKPVRKNAGVKVRKNAGRRARRNPAAPSGAIFIPGIGTI